MQAYQLYTLRTHNKCHYSVIICFLYGLPIQNSLVLFKAEYHADAEFENPLQNSEKIACVGQRLCYRIMEKTPKKPYHTI